MSFSIKTTKKIEDIASFIASGIIDQSRLGKSVLFFATGGSSIAVVSKVAEYLKNQSLPNLTVMITDERYGPVGHPDSNWFQLLEKGFAVQDAFLIPVLLGGDISETTEKFNQNLKDELERNEYKIGIFGVGKDGHTAGILPGSLAVSSGELACHYNTPTFSRITMTFNAIERLDEAVAWIQGEEKWPVIKGLEIDIELDRQPAQILKKVPLLTIFTDYEK